VAGKLLSDVLQRSAKEDGSPVTGADNVFTPIARQMGDSLLAWQLTVRAFCGPEESGVVHVERLPALELYKMLMGITAQPLNKLNQHFIHFKSAS
jgi:hypothetical protein